jgi:hypothetical protein
MAHTSRPPVVGAVVARGVGCDAHSPELTANYLPSGAAQLGSHEILPLRSREPTGSSCAKTIRRALFISPHACHQCIWLAMTTVMPFASDSFPRPQQEPGSSPHIEATTLYGRYRFRPGVRHTDGNQLVSHDISTGDRPRGLVLKVEAIPPPKY